MNELLEIYLAKYDWNSILPVEYAKGIPKFVRILDQTQDSEIYERAFEALFDKYSHAGMQFETTVAVASLMLDLLLDKNYQSKKWILQTLAHIHTAPIDPILSPQIYAQISRGIPSYEIYLKSYDSQIRYWVIIILGNLHNDYAWALDLLGNNLFVEKDYNNQKQILASINELVNFKDNFSDKYKVFILDTIYKFIGERADKFVKIYSAIIYIRIELANTPNEIFEIIYEFIINPVHITDEDFDLIKDIALTFVELGNEWLIKALTISGSVMSAELFALNLLRSNFKYTTNISIFYRIFVLSKKQKEILEFLLSHPLLWNKKWGSLSNFGLEETKELLTLQVKNAVVV